MRLSAWNMKFIASAFSGPTNPVPRFKYTALRLTGTKEYFGGDEDSGIAVTSGSLASFCRGKGRRFVMILRMSSPFSARLVLMDSCGLSLAEIVRCRMASDKIAGECEKREPESDVEGFLAACLTNRGGARKKQTRSPKKSFQMMQNTTGSTGTYH
jgi:hypothetical protein